MEGVIGIEDGVFIVKVFLVGDELLSFIGNLRHVRVIVYLVERIIGLGVDSFDCV